MTRKPVLLLIMVGIIAGIFAYSKFTVQPESSNESDLVKVGTVLGLTGENSAYGVKMKRGLEIALNEINSNKLINGKTLKLIIEDSKWDVKLGLSSFRKLYDVDGVRLFSAICGSKIALAIADVSRNDDVVILDAISTAPKLTTNGGKKYFRVCPSDALAGQNNVGWAIEEGSKSFAIVYVEDDWGASYKDSLISSLKEHGFEAYAVPVAVGARDLRIEAQKVLNKKPDAVFLAIYANLAVSFVQQARTLGLDAKVYGGDNLSSTDFSVAGNDVIEGVRISLPGEHETSRYQDFAATYKSTYNEDPDIFAIKSYDALMLLGDAIQHVGENSGDIVSYLKNMKPYDGISGQISFDNNNDFVGQQYRRLVYTSGALESWRVSK